MRPGEPATVETAKTFFENLFFNDKRYDLSRVGRLKVNKRLKLNKPLDLTTLTSDDIIETIKVLNNIRLGEDTVDDIDHLGNRRVKTVGELVQNQVRIGLSRVERSIRERLSVIGDIENLNIHSLINSKLFSTQIHDFLPVHNCRSLWTRSILWQR